MNVTDLKRKLDQSPTFWQVLQSVLSAIFGVQKAANRERDFTYGKPWQFIAVGVAVTLLILLSIYLLVRVVLATAS